MSRRHLLDPRIRCSEKEEMVSTLNRGVRMRKRGERRKGEEKEGRRGGVKKPSNRWGRTRRHEAPEPYPTHHGRGAKRPGARVPGLFPALGHTAPSPNSPDHSGREKPHRLLGRVGRLRSRHLLRRQRARP